MKASEATRVLNTARKHGEEVVELGIELIDMLAETYDSEFKSMKLECENQLNEAKQVIAELEKKVDDAQSFAARVDCSLELEAVRTQNEKLKAENKELSEKYEKLSKKFEQEVLDSVDAKKPLPSPGRKAELLGKQMQTPEKPKPRRGRPPKKADAVRSLAEELASMAPKD